MGGIGGCQHPCACRHYRNRPPLRPRLPHKCHTVTDWNRHDGDVAKELGIPRNHVTNYRNYYLIKPFQRERWKAVDWGQTDAVIAASLGVTKAAVGYQRKKQIDNTRTKE